MVKALVTGGSGFFGAILCEKLAHERMEVSNFDLAPFDHPVMGVNVHLGDIRSLDAIEKALKGADVVYHTVAQVPLAKDPELFQKVNIEGTRNVLEASLKQHVKKVIYLSSSAIYGIPKTNPVEEETPPHPMEAYGESKLEAERLCCDYVKQGLDVTIIRPRTILGPGRLGIFQILFDCIQANAAVFTLGDGHNRFQFIEASDLAEACLKAAQRPGPTSYNIGTDRFGTMRESLEGLICAVGSRSKVRSLPLKWSKWAMNAASAAGISPLGPYHALMYGSELFFKTEKAKRELGWIPRKSNVEMLLETYEWYMQNKEQLLCDGKIRSHHRSPIRAGILSLLKWIP